MAFFSPTLGRILDSYGSRGLLAVAGLAAGIAVFNLAFVTEGWQLILIFMILSLWGFRAATCSTHPCPSRTGSYAGEASRFRSRSSERPSASRFSFPLPGRHQLLRLGSCLHDPRGRWRPGRCPSRDSLRPAPARGHG